MSILSSMRYCLGAPDNFNPIWASLTFMPFGLFFDFMDGKVARWRRKSSLMGQELDSLADLVRSRSEHKPILQHCVNHTTRSPLELRQHPAHSPSVSEHPLTLFFFPTSSSVASLGLRASTSPCLLFQRTQPESRSILREHPFPCPWA